MVDFKDYKSKHNKPFDFTGDHLGKMSDTKFRKRNSDEAEF